MPDEPVFKIFRTQEWTGFEASGVFRGSSDDQRDGFIHFSSAGQVRATVEKYFINSEALVLAECASPDWGEALKWEPSRAGQDFPHLYTWLKRGDVTKYWLLSKNRSGGYDFPDIIV